MRRVAPRRGSFRSQLYRAARELGNVEAASKGPAALGKRWASCGPSGSVGDGGARGEPETRAKSLWTGDHIWCQHSRSESARHKEGRPWNTPPGR